MVVASKKNPFKKSPVNAKRSTKYRSGYEETIHATNPFLLYESTKFHINVVQADLVPVAACDVTKDGVFIPASFFTRSRSKGDFDFIQRRLHTPDWKIPAELSATGKEIIVESKGLLSLDNVHLIAAFRNSYPELDYRMLFMSNNRIGGFKTMPRVLDWCASMDIPAAVGTKIPSTWLKKA